MIIAINNSNNIYIDIIYSNNNNHIIHTYIYNYIYICSIIVLFLQEMRYLPSLRIPVQVQKGTCTDVTHTHRHNLICIFEVRYYPE